MNRYAEVQAAQEKYQLALLIKDELTKKTLLLESLTQAISAKNLLMNQLFEIQLELKSSQSNENILSNMFNSKVDEEAQRAQVALENLDYLKDAFSMQISVLAELQEYDALVYAVEEFKEMILEDFSGEEALFLDGHLPVLSSNPFKFLSENVIESADRIIEFVNDNEELLGLRFLPGNLLELEKEGMEYGSEQM